MLDSENLIIPDFPQRNSLDCVVSAIACMVNHSELGLDNNRKSALFERITNDLNLHNPLGHVEMVAAIGTPIPRVAEIMQKAITENGISAKVVLRAHILDLAGEMLNPFAIQFTASVLGAKRQGVQIKNIVSSVEHLDASLVPPLLLVDGHYLTLGKITDNAADVFDPNDGEWHQLNIDDLNESWKRSSSFSVEVIK